MVSQATWQALEVDAFHGWTEVDYSVIYTQHENGLVIAWCGCDFNSQLDVILTGLKLKKVSEVHKAVDAWVLLGEEVLGCFWPKEVSRDILHDFEFGSMLAAPSVGQIMADKKIKLAFWHKWSKLWEKLTV